MPFMHVNEVRTCVHQPVEVLYLVYRDVRGRGNSRRCRTSKLFVQVMMSRRILTKEETKAIAEEKLSSAGPCIDPNHGSCVIQRFDAISQQLS